MFGSEVWGKKQPALINSFAENLSKEPIKSTSPSGETKKETDGLTTCEGLQEGAASITPPTCQKASIY